MYSGCFIIAPKPQACVCTTSRKIAPSTFHPQSTADNFRRLLTPCAPHSHMLAATFELLTLAPHLQRWFLLILLSKAQCDTASDSTLQPEGLKGAGKSRPGDTAPIQQIMTQLSSDCLSISPPAPQVHSPHSFGTLTAAALCTSFFFPLIVYCPLSPCRFACSPVAAPANQRLPAGDRNETEAAKKSRVTTEMIDGKCARGGENWQDQGKCIVLMAWQANKGGGG